MALLDTSRTLYNWTLIMLFYSQRTVQLLEKTAVKILILDVEILEAHFALGVDQIKILMSGESVCMVPLL